LHSLLHQGVPLLLVSRTGKLLGRLLPPTAANLPLRQAQYQRNDDKTFTLKLARTIVAGKIRNQRVLAGRIVRRRGFTEEKGVLLELQAALNAVPQTQSLDALRGIEGQAAKHYFSMYRRAFAAEWAFTKRTRRPPKDPVNALLSLGYTFLVHALMAALETIGLDPYLGFFHAEKYGRPALALDLAEEFRAPLVDSLVLTLINRQTLRREDFQQNTTAPGVYLTMPGLRTFLHKFSQRLDSTITPRQIGRPLSYRKLFEVQARKLAHFIQGEAEQYEPFRAR
jgi:CRISPR-associated protein Cas1